MRWLSFRIFHQQAEEQSMRFAIRESQAVQLVPLSGITPAETAAGDPVDGSGALLGTLEFRGKTIKVFDLGPAIGLGAGYLPQRARLLVARHTRVSLPIAIAVQPELQEVNGLDASQMRQVDLRALSKLAQSRRNSD